MKFAKGILSDDKGESAVNVKPIAVPISPQKLEATEKRPVVVEKDRLFETVEKRNSNSRRYLTLFGAVCLLVVAGGIVAYYLMMPGVGDRITGTKEMEIALRDHFLIKEKRTATDIAYFKCQDFVWARVNVETRNDIPNQLLKIPSYAARITASGEARTIAALPITSPELDVPCK